MQSRGEDSNETIIDADHDEELAPEDTETSVALLQQKLRQLRKELEQTRHDSGVNLAGWQRAKADLVNFRRMTEEESVRTKQRAAARIIASLVPVLDSFDQARTHASWNSVDESWRRGMDSVAAQLRDALSKEGLESFGQAGEAFNPLLHESMSIAPAHDPAEDDTIAEVLQKGYRIGSETVRPAKVMVYQYSE